jgi:hypothetical protein
LSATRCTIGRALWGFVGAAKKFPVDTEKPWNLAKTAKAGDAAAEEEVRRTRRFLSRARRHLLYAAPAMPVISARI